MANGLINYGLLDPKLASSFSTGYREAEENRVQSEASQIKLDQLKQDRQMMTQFQQQLRSMGKNPDLGVIFDALIATGKPEYVAQGVEGHRRLSAQKEFAKIQDVGPEPAPPPMMAQPPINALAPPNALGSGTFGMEPTNALAAPPVAPVNALAAQPNQIAQTQNQIKKLMQFAASNPEMSTQAMAQARILQDQLEMYSRRGPAAPAPVKIIGNVNPSDYTPASLAIFNTSGNYSDLVPKPIKSAGDGTNVAKAPSGYRVTKTGDLEAIPGGPAADKGLKPLTELQTIKLRTDVAKDYKTATTTLSQMDDLLESIDRVKTAPGLSAAAGYTGKLPSFPSGAAAQAETRLANLRGKVTALGKSLASATGAIGSIANQEWKILADQVANLDEVKGAGPLLEQISLIEAQTAGAIARIRDQYEKTRAEDFERFPQFRDLPAPKKPGSAPGKPAAHPADIQAIIDAQKGK